MQTENLTEIVKALVKVQCEITNPANTALNSHFRAKYAPLPDILNLIRPILSKNSLFMTQNTGSCEDGNVFIQTIIMHESGETIESDKLVLKPEERLINKKTGEKGITVQSVGSAITYGRRYQLTAMLGISSEDDDDGNSASGKNNGNGSIKHDNINPADIKEDKEACGWIKVIELELKNKDWKINDNAILSKAKLNDYNEKQIERIRLQLIKRSG